MSYYSYAVFRMCKCSESSSRVRHEAAMVFLSAQAETILAHFVKVETLWSPWFYQGSGSYCLTTLLVCWYFKFRIQGFYLKLVGGFVHDHTIFSRFWLPKHTEKRLIFVCVCESPAKKSLSPWGHGKCVQNQRTPLSPSSSRKCMNKR